MRQVDSGDDLRDMLNEWGPFRAQRIDVVEVAKDWSYAVVRLDLQADNGNYYGTAFGGSLFSMVDPFFVLLALQQLGDGYVVWDKAAEIDFRRPGVQPVTARIEMPAEVVEELRAAAADGAKVLRWFEVDLVAEDGTVVATSRRQLYVRRQRAPVNSPGTAAPRS